MTGADTRSEILDATMRALSAHGIARLSLEDVAREADLSRQTVYRYFGSRDALLEAAIVREEQAFLDDVAAAAATHDDLRPAMEAAVRTALTAARAHPLLDRLLQTEPEALLPFLTTGAGPVLSAARPALEDLLAERLPHAPEQRIGRAADVATRLIISYVLNPPAADVDALATSVADLLVDGLTK